MNVYDFNEHIRFHLPDGFLHRTVHDEDGEIQEQIVAKPFANEDGNEDYRLQINVETKQFASSYEVGQSDAFFLKRVCSQISATQYAVTEGACPIAFMGKQLSFGFGRISLYRSLILIYIHLDEGTVLSLGTVTSYDEGTDELDQLFEDVLKVIEGIEIDEVKISVHGLQGTSLSRVMEPYGDLSEEKMGTDVSFLLPESVRFPDRILREPYICKPTENIGIFLPAGYMPYTRFRNTGTKVLSIVGGRYLGEHDRNETGFEFSFTVVPFISDEAYGNSSEDMLRSFFIHHTPDGLYRKYMLFPGKMPAALSVLRGYVMGIKMISLQMSLVIDDKTVLNISHQHTGNPDLQNSDELYQPLLKLAEGMLINLRKPDFEGITAKDISVKLYSDSNYQLVEEVRNPANEWLMEYGEYLEKNPKISLKGRKFVFTGVIFRDDEKKDPIVQKLMERGGEHSSKVSGLTDCLVVNPMHAGEKKIEAVLDRIDEGKQIQIVHIDDFMAALENKSGTAAEPAKKHNGDKVESEPAAADKTDSQEAPENPDYILEGTALKCYVGTGTDLTLPKGITEIMPNAFSSNSELKTVVIPFGVEVIDEDAFRNCFNLQYITLPGTLRKISARAFMGCAALTFIEVPKKTGEIGDQAFYNCFRLKRITIPEHAVLGRDALNTCSPDTAVYKSVSAVKPAADTEKKVSQANPVSEEIHKNNTETIKTHPVRSERIHDKQKYPHLFDKYFEDNPDIVIRDHVFVFCGVKTGDPMMLDLLKKGGRYFQNPSRNVDYLVVSPHFHGKAAIEKAISLKEKGYDIKIVHLSDFQKALESAEPVYCDDFLVENGRLINYLSTEPDVIVPDRVTDLSSGLRYNKFIRTVKLPDELTEVGFLAFKDCINLQRVALSDSIRNIDICAFENCTSLVEICLPEGLSKIQSSAFRNCSSLHTLVIPESVDNIGSGAFEKCKQLTLRVKEYSYAEEYCKKNGLKYITEIPKKAEASTKNDTDYPIPFVDEDGTLFGWDLEAVQAVIPNGVRYIGTAAFAVCEHLTSVFIPNSVKKIGDGAFSDCKSLTSVVIPESVSEIGNSAFCGCKSLQSIEIPDNVKCIGEYAFTNCESLVSVEIPDSVEKIGKSTFWGCENLSSIEIPNKLTSIEEYTFSGCRSLTSIVIPESITEIDDYAFLGCDNLIFTVKSGSYAEQFCINNGLKYVLMEDTSGQELSEFEIEGADKESAEKEEIYRNALDYYNDNSFAGINHAVSLLEKLSDYKDVKELLAKVPERRTEIENNNRKIYEKALELMTSSSISSLRTAKYQFEALNDWKDSKKHAEFCRKQIDKYNEEIRIKQEEAKQSMKDKETEAQKKRVRTVILVFLLIIAVIAAFTIPPKIKKYQEYKEIIALGESGNYELALERLAPFAEENYKDSNAYYEQFEEEQELANDRKEADALLENYENWYISNFEFSELIKKIDLLNEDALKAGQRRSLKELRQIAEELDLLYIHGYDDLHETLSNKMDDHNPTDLQKLKTITEPALIPDLCEEMEKYEKYISRTYSGIAVLDDFGDTSLSGEAELKLTTDLGFQTEYDVDSSQNIIEIVVIYRLEIWQEDDWFNSTVFVGYEPVSSLTKKLPLREKFADSFDDPVAYFMLTEKSSVIDGKVKLKLETDEKLLF